MPAEQRDANSMRLSDCLERLETIAREMERELDLEVALDLYAEGVTLARRASVLLADARLRVRELDETQEER